MAIFMPLDSNFSHLSFHNILKFQTPTQLFQQFVANNKSETESFVSKSNLFSGGFNGKVLNTQHIMTDDKHKPLDIQLDVINHADDSCNSTDSDLSVGQEKIDDDKSNFDQTESEIIDNQLSNNMMEQDDDNSSNASSSKHINISSSRLCNTQNPKLLTESTIQTSIMRPNPSRLHEEIFRNSQIYAEELVKQQLAAAARLQSISASKNYPHIGSSVFDEKQRLSLLNSNNEEIDPSLVSKLNLPPSVFVPKIMETNQNGNNLFCNSKSAINFQNIHSHLSAISQITNNLTNSIKKDDSTSLSSLSRESSQSPSSFQHLKQQHHHQNMIFHTQQNQLHERNLKFSIDNILKADFGRRITEPLLRSSKSRKALRDGKQDKEMFKKFNAPAASKDSFGRSPDDNHRISENSHSSHSPSMTEQSKSESNKGSNSSSSGTVWPAWVFCTRYSDRPSSGKC
ncbi:CLUMA_CG013298, isoform A [Clunio marinus]|uniref:CLUMA_CG013298, isoform A n=1 Tax=Clunio marinus TaxID=568069 RepID=A0A1J1III1_9DIPT|nr:CLUMA_CG013298, isoform A [Clunio marinus]